MSEEDLCPDSLVIQIPWTLVKYYTKPNGSVGFDTKNPPIQAPYNTMVFKGYVENRGENTIGAKFVKAGLKNVKGCRLPRTAGGSNKEFFGGLKRCKTEAERVQFKRDNASQYNPKYGKARWGPADPDV